ncbi:MAG: hypothetical protein EXS39_05350 [Opitutaceae bacterium]|nr:hypothetical protein [Opitutaceae bacterium]
MAGAIGLVVGAVGLTIIVLRPKPPLQLSVAQALASAKAATAPPAANTAATGSPVIVAPIVTSSKPAESTPAIVEPVASTPAAKSPAGQVLPAKTRTIPVVAAKSAVDVPPDPRIVAFVDGLKVTGIRSSGAESKVLMNDHVYRINDVVDRILNVRLTEVGPDSLTFVDENGAAYTKNF